jgi:hypothetical protein
VRVDPQAARDHPADRGSNQRLREKCHEPVPRLAE